MHKRAEEANSGAIQTEYAGHLFRSRLEARWAVFFDHAGIKWQYELQGYECKGHRYLPDFYLPDSNDFVEVKGDPEGLQKDYERMSVILGESSPLPGFTKQESSLILLGDIPFVSAGTAHHKCLKYNEGSLKSFLVTFLPFGEKNSVVPFIDGGFILPKLFGLNVSTNLNKDSKGWIVESVVMPTPVTFPKLNDAYSAARKARFEHGECGGR